MVTIAADIPSNDDDQTLLGANKPGALMFVGVPRVEVIVRREGGRPTQRVLQCEGEHIRIGSHPSNEVVLDDRRVSRFHCAMSVAKTAWTLTDGGSLNGTFLSGVLVRDATLPSAECEIAVGDSLIRIIQLRPERVCHLPELDRFGELRGTGVAMRQVFNQLTQVAPSDATVLVQGESGTGKELVAHELVRRSGRAAGPIITVDCSAISPTLIESELFGHARGAFTGADKTRIGAFEAAHRGTIFLDEIGEMPLDMQPKLLRALENREIRRAGENESRKVDVRVIAATNRQLEREVNRGRFREDLYFRLSVFTVRLPPLRERLQDIPDLVDAFLQRMGASDLADLFTPKVYEDLKRHDWPGNVRELRNYVERALITRETTSRFPHPLTPRLAAAESGNPQKPGTLNALSSLDGPFKPLKESLIAGFEEAYLTRLMSVSGGNISLAARKAMLDRMYLYRLLERHGLGRGPGGDK